MTGKSRKTDCFCTRLKNCVMSCLSCLACRVVAKHNAANLSLKVGCIVAVPKALEVIALLLVAKRKTCPVPSTDSVTRKVCFYYYEYMRCFLSLNNCPLTGFTWLYDFSKCRPHHTVHVYIIQPVCRLSAFCSITHACCSVHQKQRCLTKFKTANLLVILYF